MTENFVLVTVDSLRADHVGCYGYDRETTPNLDEYAERGHRFTTAHAHACATRPSFPAILTSSHSLMYGGFERISPERTLVSEAMSDLGYATGGFHSNLYLSADFGYDRGWDTLFDSRGDSSLMTKLRHAVKSRLDDDGWVYGILERLYQGTERAAGVNVGTHHVLAEDITDRALSWARDHADRPTFLWVHYMDPHHPYAPPAEYSEFSSISPRAGVRLRPKMMENDEEITEEELQTLIDLYDDEIRYTDAQIDRLLSSLDDLWDDWTAIITADHGEEFRDHDGFFHYNTFYDEVTHVPLIVYDGETAGVHDDIVGLLDVSPTLVSRAGADELPANFWGYSLDPLLDGRPADWSREGVRGGWCRVDTGVRRLAYRTADWKYIRDYVHDDEELYDLRADPGEQSNLLDGDEREPDVLNELRRVVDEYEDDIEATDTEVESVEMDDDVKERLRNLGYQE